MQNSLDATRRGLYSAQDTDINPGGGTGSHGFVNDQKDTAGAGVSGVEKITQSAFSAFGYDASPEELGAFSKIYSSYNGGNVLAVNAAVSNYLTTVQRFQNLNANDPTKHAIADERGFFTDTQRQAAGYESQATDVYNEEKDLAGQAPKLFGNLTPDQIDEYLAPTKRANDQSNAKLQGQAAARGLAGSSTELNTLADQERQYKENVLATGLAVGQDAQKTQLGVLNSRQGQLFNAGQTERSYLPGSLGRSETMATNQQAALTDQTNYLNQLPLFLASSQPAPTLPAPTGSKNFFSPGQAGNALLQGAVQGGVQAATKAAF